MKTLIILITLLVSANIQAFDNGEGIILMQRDFDPEYGLWYDPERDGEGIILLKRDNVIQFNFFTYIERCKHRNFDDESLIIIDENYRPCRQVQIWYVTGQHPITDGQATGPLYTANPFDLIVPPYLADVVPIGLFILTKTIGGFHMTVLHTGNVLDPSARIYDPDGYNFRSHLFPFLKPED